MNPLPSPETLAALVSSVTETMFGLSFSMEKSGPNVPKDRWRAAVLPIPGKRPLTVAIASDQSSCATLGSAMFQCSPDAVDSSMMNDSLAELVNIVAGQIKSSLALDQALGLPKVIEPNEANWTPPEAWRSATVTRGDTRTVVWVAVTEQLL